MKRYITQAEVDLLPLEPRARFVAIYELVNDRFENELAKIDPQNEWHLIDSARVRFAAAMMGFAHSLGIGEVADVSFPDIQSKIDGAFEKFELSLAHVVTQFMTDNSLRAHVESLELRGSTKERLEKLTAAMRVQVAQLDLSADKR